MDKDMDIRFYIKERFAESPVWESAVELLQQNGVKTVRALGSKGGIWIGQELYKDLWLGNTTEIDYSNPVRVLIKEIHEDCFDIVHNAHLAYDDGTPIAECLFEYKSDIPETDVIRIANALESVGIKTMTALCAASHETIRNACGLGRDDKPFVLNMRTYFRNK